MAYAAYERPGMWFTPPVRLDPSVAGALVVDRYAQDRGGAGGVTRYGRLTLRWDAVSDIAAARAAVGSDDHPATVQSLPVEGGVVRLTGPAVLVEPHTGAPALGAALPLDQAGLASFVATVGLDDLSTTLVVDAYERGLPLIGADVVLVARGVAARHPGTARIAVEALSALLLAEAADGIIDVDRVRQLLIEDSGAAGVSYTSGEPGDDAGVREAAGALTDRIIARFGTPVDPSTRQPEALELGARLPARVQLTFDATVGLLTWDLSVPSIAPRLFGLASSGILPAAGEGLVVHEHQPPALPSGWHQVSVATTVRPPWSGATLGCEVAVAPAPPLRPQTVRHPLLFTGESDATVDLRLSPLEPLAGTVTGVVIHDSGQEARGTPVPLTHESLVVRTDAFEARFLPLELVASMQSDAVTVHWFAGEPTHEDDIGSATARLGQGAANEVTLVVPPGADGTLVVRAVDADGRTATAAPTPARPLSIHPFLFPGTGSQSVDVEVTFGSSPEVGVDLEFLPEEAEGATPARLHVSRHRPRATWSRFVDTPFATGFRWRAGSAPWSDVVHPTPGAPLLIDLVAAGTTGHQPLGATTGGAHGPA